MSTKEPTQAQILASVIQRRATISSSEATVQRSHRFPVFFMVQIENIAYAAGVPVSSIINQLIEIGLETLSKELPEESIKEIITVRKEQYSMLGLTPDGESQETSPAKKPRKTNKK